MIHNYIRVSEDAKMGGWSGLKAASVGLSGDLPELYGVLRYHNKVFERAEL